MDLPSVLADTALLASLSREYELLKASNAAVNWEQWITTRLKRAAAARAAGTSITVQANQQQQHQRLGPAQQQQQQRVPVRLKSVNLRTPSSKASAHVSNPSAAQSRRGSAADGGQQQPTCVDWQAQDITNGQSADVQQQQQQPPSFLTINNSSGPGQWQVQSRTAAPPQWVAAAKLGVALQASKVIPAMHAAADHERRLTAAAASARQQLELGIAEPSAGMTPPRSDEQELQPHAQQQLQQVVMLTKEVAQQNQALQHALLQQQAQLTQHQGLLASVLQHSSTPPGALQAVSPAQLPMPAAAQPAAAPAPAATTHAQAPAAARTEAAPPSAAATGSHGDAAACTPGLLPQRIRDSWLVKNVLQQDSAINSSSKQGVGAAAAAPEFIRIAGAAKRPIQRLIEVQQPAAASQEGKQQEQAALGTATDPAARRKQLKVALRQLLTRSAVESLPDGLPGLLHGLRGLQSGSALRAQPQQLGSDVQQDAAVSLAALLQQQQHKRQQRTQLSKAQELVLQRRKEQQEELRRQQQAESRQQESNDRPGWQSDVYVAPPSRMLRVKKAGAADVWNHQQRGPPGSKAGPGAQHTQGSRGGNSGGRPQQKPQKAAQASSTRRGRPSVKRQSLSAVLHGAGWRVDGSLRRQQPLMPQGPAVDDVDQSAGQQRLEHAAHTTTQALDDQAHLEEHVQQQQLEGLQQPTVQPAAGSSQAGELRLEPSALNSLLAALDRLDQQEQEIRDRWFGSGSSSSSCASGGDAAERDQQAPCSPHSHNGSSQDQQEAVVLSASPGSPAAVGHVGSCAGLVEQPLHQQGAALPECQPCWLSAATVKSIKASRQRLLQHQALLDGHLHQLGSGRAVVGSITDSRGHGKSSRGRCSSVLQPTQVVEAVADVLLDELVLLEATELEEFCDELCSQLVEDEFEEA